MNKQLTKGNEAIVKAAVLAGCRAFYGYPDHSRQRDHRSRRALPPAGRRRLRPGGKRSRRHQHAVRRRRGRCARHDRIERPRHLSDAGGLQLSGRRGAPLRRRRYHARRSRSRQYRARAGRLQPGRQGRRAWQLPHSGPRARFRAGNGRPHHLGLRPRRRISQSRGRARRRIHRPDDGAGRVRAAPAGSAARSMGSHRDGGIAPQPDQLHLPRARRAGAPHPQARGQVSRSRTPHRARRMLAHRRRRDHSRRLRHCRPHPQSRGRTGAGARDQGRAAAADHALSRSRWPRFANSAAAPAPSS